jgi:hypothetical protein
MMTTEPGAIERLVSKEPEIDLVPFDGVDHVKHTGGVNGFFHGPCIHIETRSPERFYEVGNLVPLDGDEHIEIVM